MRALLGLRAIRSACRPSGALPAAGGAKRIGRCALPALRSRSRQLRNVYLAGAWCRAHSRSEAALRFSKDWADLGVSRRSAVSVRFRSETASMICLHAIGCVGSARDRPATLPTRRTRTALFMTTEIKVFIVGGYGIFGGPRRIARERAAADIVHRRPFAHQSAKLRQIARQCRGAPDACRVRSRRRCRGAIQRPPARTSWSTPAGRSRITATAPIECRSVPQARHQLPRPRRRIGFRRRHRRLRRTSARRRYLRSLRCIELSRPHRRGCPQAHHRHGRRNRDPRRHCALTLCRSWRKRYSRHCGLCRPACSTHTRRTISSGYPFTEQFHYTIAPPGCVPLERRMFSLVDVPDLRALSPLWPEAKDIWMGAAPVPQILHRGLALPLGSSACDLSEACCR